MPCIVNFSSTKYIFFPINAQSFFSLYIFYFQCERLREYTIIILLLADVDVMQNAHKPLTVDCI